MRKRQWLVPKERLLSVLARIDGVTVFTCYDPAAFPEALKSIGIRERDLTRNRFLGTTFSRPNPTDLVIGTAYDDAHDVDPNEDHFFWDGTSEVLTPYFRGRYEKLNPAYRGTHRGNKDYLRR